MSFIRSTIVRTASRESPMGASRSATTSSRAYSESASKRPSRLPKCRRIVRTVTPERSATSASPIARPSFSSLSDQVASRICLRVLATPSARAFMV